MVSHLAARIGVLLADAHRHRQDHHSAVPHHKLPTGSPRGRQWQQTPADPATLPADVDQVHGMPHAATLMSSRLLWESGLGCTAWRSQLSLMSGSMTCLLICGTGWQACLLYTYCARDGEGAGRAAGGARWQQCSHHQAAFHGQQKAGVSILQPAPASDQASTFQQPSSDLSFHPAVVAAPKELIEYRNKYLGPSPPPIMALGLSSRKNLCIHPKVAGEVAQAHQHCDI